jgi:hypothetical protein
MKISVGARQSGSTVVITNSNFTDSNVAGDAIGDEGMGVGHLVVQSHLPAVDGWGLIDFPHHFGGNHNLVELLCTEEAEFECSFFQC